MTSKSQERKHQNSNKQVARIVKSMLVQNIETKQYTSSYAAAPYFDGAGSVLYSLVTGLVVGNANGQRVGDRIEAKSLDIKMLLSNGIGATANQHTTTRVIVFQYFGDTAIAVPPIGSFLNGSAANAGGTYGAMSPINEDTTQQFRVLYDTTVSTVGTMGLAALGTTGVGSHVVLNHNVPLKRCQRRLQFSAGATTGINLLHILVTSDNATIATNPTVQSTLNLLYTDA